MSEVQKLPSFTTIQYVTKDGEKCTATKNNGVVTVQGDKNGVRQVPVDDFMKELVATLPKVDLEKTPKKDTVNFSGSEISDDDKSLRNKYLKIGAGVVAALGAATTLFFVGKGKWWMKAAKNVETKGEELVNDAAQGLRGQSGKAGEKAEQAAEETLEHAAPKVEPPVTEAKPKVETNPKPEEIVATKNEEVVKPTETVAPAEDARVAFVGERGIKSPVPFEQICEIPKELETDLAKLTQNHEVFENSFGQKILKVENVEGKYDRIYFLNNEKTEITHILDNIRGEGAFRRIGMKNGEITEVRDLTTDSHVFFPPKKPQAKKPEMKSSEINTQSVQDATTDDAIIAAAALEHAIASTVKKPGTIDEAVGRIVEKGNQIGMEQLAHAAETPAVPKGLPEIKIPEAPKAVEETIAETATSGEQAARELFGGDGVKSADEMFAQTKSADEMFSPHSDIINEPHVDVLHNPNAHADVINEPHIDVLQTPHVDEPVAGFNGTSPENYFAETSFRRGYDELDEIRLGENDEILPDMISRHDPFADPLSPIGDSSYHLDESGFSGPNLDDFAV